MKRSKAGTQEKRSPDGPNYRNQNTINNEHNMAVFYKIWKVQ